MTRLRHVAAINPQTPEFDALADNADITFIPLEAVWPDDRFDTSQRRTKEQVSSGYTRFREGDILVPKITPTFQADRTVIAEGIEGGIAAGTTELHIVRVGDTASRRYVRYLLSSKPFLDEGEASMIGVAGQKRVPDACLRDLRLPIVDPHVQRAIADFLDAETARIDALIKKKQEIVDLLRGRGQSALDVWADGQFHSWPTVPFRRLLDGIEQGWSPQCDSTPADPEEWGVLKTSSISSGEFRAGENKRLPIDIEPDLRWVVMDRDLLMVRGSGSRAMVGQAAVAHPGDRLLMMSDLTYRLRYRASDAAYLAAMLRSSQVRGRLESRIRTDTGTTLKVRVDDISELPMPLAPEDEQRLAIESLDLSLERGEAVRRRIGEQVLLLRERRQALITAAVTGELEIVGIAA